MNESQQKIINKDLILRERLALERTEMANDRTLLSFIRTALYFSIAGLSVNSLLRLDHGFWIEGIFWVLAFVILVIGLRKFLTQRRKLKDNEKHIGNYRLEWEDDDE